ncbi:MAG: hypothetical protein L3J68_00145 [Thermoplasmata archaeon]|nr:hypothetical protein [Thermoplasmata archaeon]
MNRAEGQVGGIRVADCADGVYMLLGHDHAQASFVAFEDEANHRSDSSWARRSCRRRERLFANPPLLQNLQT